MNATTSVFAVNLHNYEGRDIVGKVLTQEAFDADSIGKALPGVAVKVVLPNDHSVEMNAGEEGLLLLKGASISPVRCGMVMQEHQEWMSTGWSGYIDSKGFIHILSREAKRMEKREAC
jgi:acyl-CoA synthetase (AMP-forming)/AMP-acid ligase II